MTPTEAATVERIKASRARIARSALAFELSRPLPPIPNSVFADANDILDDVLSPSTNYEVRRIQQAVMTEFPYMQMVDFKSDRQMQNVVRPRQIAMFLARQMTGKSLPKIGIIFGGRHHTTIMHAISKIEEMIASDPVFAETVNRIRGRFLRVAE